jgi:deoxyribonuclease-4
LRFGVHVSIKNGFKGAAGEALKLGCDGFQIFAANPRGWARKELDAAEVADFQKMRSQTTLWPVVVHMAYLPNPAAADPELSQKSVQTFAADFGRANLLGADFFVLHPGKAKDHRETALLRVAAMVNRILDEVRGPTLMLFENQAGMGSEIAAELEDLGRLLSLVAQPLRVGICFDTCHAFAAGYDLSSRQGWERTLDQIEKFIGLEKIKVFHINDSTGDLGSKLDRHHHIGQGKIGLAGFEYMVNHPQISKIPGILETPQHDAEDDRRNLATLRNLVQGAGKT